MNTQYQIVRNRKSEKYHIRKKRNITIQAGFWRKEWIDEIVSDIYVEYYSKGTPLRYTTQFFDSIDQAQKRVDQLIVEDKVDNRYEGEWQP